MNQARRALAEFVGTALLVAAVVGSGVAAVRFSPHDVNLELLENSVITGGATSIANPAVTVARMFSNTCFRIVGTRERLGQHHGTWRNVVLIKRRSSTSDQPWPCC